MTDTWTEITPTAWVPTPPILSSRDEWLAVLAAGSWWAKDAPTIIGEVLDELIAVGATESDVRTAIERVVAVIRNEYES